MKTHGEKIIFHPFYILHYFIINILWRMSNIFKTKKMFSHACTRFKKKVYTSKDNAIHVFNIKLAPSSLLRRTERSYAQTKRFVCKIITYPILNNAGRYIFCCLFTDIRICFLTKHTDGAYQVMLHSDSTNSKCLFMSKWK